MERKPISTNRNVRQGPANDATADVPSFQKLYDLANLQEAFSQVKNNNGSSGVDRQTIKAFEQQLKKNLESIAADLRNGDYRPRPILRVWIDKPGSQEKRPLGIPTVRDRVVQTALRSVIEPVFEKGFADHSYGFRPGRGPLGALQRVMTLLKEGHTYVLDADLKSYFDTIPHHLLLELVGGKIVDGQLRALVNAFLEQQVLSDLGTTEPEAGTPQGAVISPLLSNIYLDPLDHLIAECKWEMVRYADDFVILCRSYSEAKQAHARVQEWTEQRGLKLHSEKTRVVNERDKGGFDFLGYHFEQGKVRPRQKSEQRLKEKVCSIICDTKPQTLHAVIVQLNSFLKSWFEHFQLCPPAAWGDLDRWICLQIRIRRNSLDRNSRLQVASTPWSNDFINQRGLFSLKKAASRR